MWRTRSASRSRRRARSNRSSARRPHRRATGGRPTAGHVEQVARSIQARYLGSREIQPLLKWKLGDIARSHGATEGLELAFDKETGFAYLLVFFLPDFPSDVREARAVDTAIEVAGR